MVILDWLLQLIERIVVWFSLRKTEPPPAKLGEEASGGLGTSAETGERISLSPRDLARHCYLLGSTGCGKTTLILKLLERDIAQGHTVAVVDMRGDLVAGTLALCARLGRALCEGPAPAGRHRLRVGVLGSPA